MAQLIVHRPAKQKVIGSIPDQGTCLDCGFSPGQMLLLPPVPTSVPGWDMDEKQPVAGSLSHRCFSPFFSLPSPLPENK